MIDVIIADDDVHIVEQLSCMLTKEKDIRVVRTCSNGLDTIMSYNSLRPTTLILDLDLPGVDGLSVLENLENSVNDVIIYSDSDFHYSQIGDAKKVRWVIKKTSKPETLIPIIRKIKSEKDANIYKNLPTEIDKAFKNLHFKQNYKGVSYLKSAILISYPNTNISLKGILDKLEEEYACNPSTIQSIMQKYLRKSYNEQKDKNIYYEMFPEYCGDEPSPKTFISCMINYLNRIYN